MARNIITFELRKGKDDDIERALTKLVSVDNDRSSVIRTALRSYFNPTTNKTASRVARTIVEDSLEDFELVVAEKDDTQLDDALDNLLQF